MRCSGRHMGVTAHGPGTRGFGREPHRDQEVSSHFLLPVLASFCTMSLNYKLIYALDSCCICVVFSLYCKLACSSIVIFHQEKKTYRKKFPVLTFTIQPTEKIS
jgi:hypothetical protein